MDQSRELLMRESTVRRSMLSGSRQGKSTLPQQIVRTRARVRGVFAAFERRQADDHGCAVFVRRRQRVVDTTGFRNSVYRIWLSEIAATFPESGRCRALPLP